MGGDRSPPVMVTGRRAVSGPVHHTVFASEQVGEKGGFHVGDGTWFVISKE